MVLEKVLESIKEDKIVIIQSDDISNTISKLSLNLKELIEAKSPLLILDTTSEEFKSKVRVGKLDLYETFRMCNNGVISLIIVSNNTVFPYNTKYFNYTVINLELVGT